MSAIAALLALALAGCSAMPAHETRVVTMGADASPEDRGVPPPGTTWRLDEHELLALSPAPYVPPPPTPIPQPPRVAPVVPYAVPYPYYGFGVPYYGPSFGFSFGYSHPRHHSHRRWRR
ncbi:MAG TPA: hypothetical protein VIQ62_01010 [Burkholderiales bacterium]